MTDRQGGGQDLADKRAPLSARQKRRLLGKLRTAARLLEAGEISGLHYAAVAVQIASRLGEDTAPGESLVGKRISAMFYLPGESFTVLKDAAGGLEEALSEFGPWNKATAWLYREFGRGHASGEFVWDEEIQELLEEARLRLKLRTRLMFRTEEWLERNRKYFPRTTELLQKAVIAFGAAVVGSLVTLLVTSLGGG